MQRPQVGEEAGEEMKMKEGQYGRTAVHVQSQVGPQRPQYIV